MSLHRESLEVGAIVGVDRGAERNWVASSDQSTPLDGAVRSWRGVAWLRDIGAVTSTACVSTARMSIPSGGAAQDPAGRCELSLGNDRRTSFRRAVAARDPAGPTRDAVLGRREAEAAPGLPRVGAIVEVPEVVTDPFTVPQEESPCAQLRAHVNHPGRVLPSAGLPQPAAWNLPRDLPRSA